MADLSFYKYLEAAFRHKLFKDKAATRFNYLSYNLSYERIFYYARKVLPAFYRNEFPNTEEGNLQLAKTVLEKLDNHRDRELENQFKGAATQVENDQIIEQVAAESQQASIPPEQAVPAGTTSGGGMPRMPAAPRLPAMPRPTHNIPHAPEPPPPKSELVVVNKSGIVAETPPKSQLVTASSSGAIKETPPKQIFIANKSGIVTEMRNIKSPSFLKTFGSNTQIFAKKNLGRIANGLGGFAGGVARELAGPGLTGAYNILGKATNSGLNAFERISRPGGLGGGAGGGFSKSSEKKIILSFLGLFLIFVVLATAVSSLPGTTPTPVVSPNPVTGGDISSCKFTRAGSPPAESYKSPTLLSYFQQASNVSSIPAVVLAAITRVESPSVTGKTDADLPYLSSKEGCPRSDTGALGIMQIQPPGTTGYVREAVNQGASYLGKTAEQLTEEDFCDVKNNIIIASGFILKKLQLLYGLGDGTKWDPSWTNNKDIIYKVAESYYGCLPYGGPDPLKCEGPYNYGDDIWTSIQNCQTGASVASSCPATGRISTPYGFNIPQYPDVANEGCGGLSRCHNGIDIAAAKGSPVKAPISGNITSGFGQYKGNYVQINDPVSDLTVTLEHLDTITATQNSPVSKGEIIGTVGQTGEGVTGPVLHYKIEKGGVLTNPLMTLGDSATLDSNLLKSASSIQENNYEGVTPTSGNTDNWGDCKQ